MRRIIPRSLKIILLLTLLAGLACATLMANGPASSSAAAASSVTGVVLASVADKDKPYTITVQTVPGTGAVMNLQFIFTIPQGYHLDKKAPMNIKLTPPEGVSFAKNPLGWSEAVAYDEFKSATLQTSFTGASAGQTEAKIRFAICTETNCQLKQETITFGLKK